MQNVTKQQDFKTEANTGKPNIRGFVNISEDERLLEDSLRPGIEKLQLLTKMLRRNAMFNNATPIAKPK